MHWELVVAPVWLFTGDKEQVVAMREVKNKSVGVMIFSPLDASSKHGVMCCSFLNDSLMFTEVIAGYKISELLSFLQNLDIGLTATSFFLGFNEILVRLLFCQDPIG